VRKRDELADPKSCLNKARDDERLFVLLERDEAAPNTVRYWISERIRLGLNRPGDPKIVEAGRWIEAVEAERPAGGNSTVAEGPSEFFRPDGTEFSWQDY
jgi:hypothetical protein